MEQEIISIGDTFNAEHKVGDALCNFSLLVPDETELVKSICEVRFLLSEGDEYGKVNCLFWLTAKNIAASAQTYTSIGTIEKTCADVFTEVLMKSNIETRYDCKTYVDIKSTLKAIARFLGYEKSQVMFIEK